MGEQEKRRLVWYVERIVITVGNFLKRGAQSNTHQKALFLVNTKKGELRFAMEFGEYPREAAKLKLELNFLYGIFCHKSGACTVICVVRRTLRSFSPSREW